MKRLTYPAACIRVFDLALGEMLWSRRTIFMLLVVGGPVVIAAVFRLLEGLTSSGLRVDGARLAGPTIFGLMVWIFYLRFSVPVLGIFYGTSLIADEVDDKTITYLFTRPIPRGAVLLGKYLAYGACTTFVVLPSVVLVFLLIAPTGGAGLGQAFPWLVKDLAILGIGLAVYGALFAMVGAWFKRPLLTGLLFIFGWEQFALTIPGYLRRFTVAYYLQALVPHGMPQDSVLSFLQSIFVDSPSTALALTALALMWGGFLTLAALAVERREYVLEQ